MKGVTAANSALQVMAMPQLGSTPFVAYSGLSNSNN
jgi:hypothetical protein